MNAKYRKPAIILFMDLRFRELLFATYIVIRIIQRIKMYGIAKSIKKEIPWKYLEIIKWIL
jgi:hypothetical protein